jgi:hypothetical protein
MCRYRGDDFNRVLAPEGEILSFASPNHMEMANVAYAGRSIFPQKEETKA